MNKEGAIKKKMLTSHKGQSPSKKKRFDFDFRARSSIDLLRQFEIRREKIANERKNYGVQGQTPSQKRKDHMPTTMDANEGQSKLNAIQYMCNQKQGHNNTMRDLALENRKRKNPMPTTLDANEGQSRLNSIQAKCSQKQVQNMLPMHKTMAQSSQRQGHNNLPISGIIPQVQEEDQPDILELQSPKKAKKKPIYPSMTVDQFLEKQGIPVGIEEQLDIEPMEEDDEENNITSDDDVADLEVGENNFDEDQVMDTDCDEGGIYNYIILFAYILYFI